jgi:general secretion pathway protein E
MINNIIPFMFAKRHGLFIEALADDCAHIVHHGPIKSSALAEVRRIAKRPIKLREVPSELFEQLLAKNYETGTHAAMEMMAGMEEQANLLDLVDALPRTEDLLESEDDAPIIRLINAILTQAIKQTASDIHIETFEQKLMVRFRVDGVLHAVLEPPRLLAPLLVSRIKVMAKLDIAEKRLPQDGRIALRIAGRPVDVRVSTLPSTHGERVVMRLLDKQNSKLDLQHLGMTTTNLELMQQLIHRPHGIILVTGPTGSGKTTTLYAALTDLNDHSRNILTVEDPVEYELSGIGQTQVNTKINMTFARGLRSILRQDPDVVMIGEIRDKETAEIAVQASLTGHLVLSTLHTNSAIGAITRLKDMGVESFLLSATIIGVAAQRLVRVLCQECKQGAVATAAECQLMNIDFNHPPTIYQAKGCAACSGTGYRGRKGIYELIAINEELRQMIHDHRGEAEMEKAARKHFHSIRQDGFQHVIAGDTTLKEVLLITDEDNVVFTGEGLLV